MFSFEEREEMLLEEMRAATPSGADRLSVVSFTGLVIDAAVAEGASILVRGLRDGTDLELRDGRWPA